MNLNELENYFEGYVHNCLMNKPNLPQEFEYTNYIDEDNDGFLTVISSRGEVDDVWLNNAVHNLLMRYPVYEVTWAREDDGLGFNFEIEGNLSVVASNNQTYDTSQ